MGSKQVSAVLLLLLIALGWAEAQLPSTTPTTAELALSGKRFDPRSVKSSCNKTAVNIEVQKDVLADAGDLAALTLGGCPARTDDSSQVLIYESELEGCNSKLTVTGTELIYVFTLGGAPSNPPILIACHYPRVTAAPTGSLTSAWVPHSSPEADEEPIFSLRLMMDDWISERASNQYYLGDLINVEASALLFNQIPLRIFVDRCVAAAAPDTNTLPRYSFIDNYGCLIDAKLTHSGSQFMPQTQPSKLGFQIEAFRFQQVNSSMIYITCFLKAALAWAPADFEHKSCSFSDYGWTSVYGADQVCSCCDSRCSMTAQDQARNGHHLATQVTLGPIMVEEDI